MERDSASEGRSRGERSRRLAWWFAGGTLLAVVLSGIWSLIVGTASPGADEKDLVQGWSGVLRNVPGYAVVVLVGGISVLFATRARRLRADGAHAALVASCVALFLGLASITRDAAEVQMTTRAATMTWLLAAASLVIAAVVYVQARLRTRG